MSTTAMAANMVKEKMTNIRWQIMFLVFVIMVLNYLDRVNISVAAPFIQKEFGFTPVQLGVIFSAFAWGNVIGQIPGGVCSAMFGAKRMYIIAIVCWSALLACTTLANTLTTFVILRVAFGIFEGMCWPVASTVGATWFPKTERSRAMSLQSSGMVVGLAIAPPFVTYFMLAYGWRIAFLVSAGLSLLWLIFWAWKMNDKPHQHSQVNKVELDFITECDTAQKDVTFEDKPLTFMQGMKIVLKKPSLYALVLSNSALNWTLYTYISWLPLYLQHERGFTIAKSGLIGMLPFIFSMATIPLGGYIADYIHRSTGSVRKSKNITISTSLLLGGIALIPAAMTEDPMTSVILLSIGYSLVMLILGPQWAIPPDIGGKKAAGYAGGIAQVLSHVTGIIAPIFMGYVVQATGHYTAGLVASGAAAIIGAACFPLLYRGEKDYITQEELDKVIAEG